VERAQAYVEAGADMIFVESLTQRSHMEELVRQIGDYDPLLHNLLRPADEVTDAAEVEEMGYSVALFPGALTNAVGAAMDSALTMLKAKASVEGLAKQPDRIGAAEYLK